MLKIKIRPSNGTLRLVKFNSIILQENVMFGILCLGWETLDKIVFTIWLMGEETSITFCMQLK